MPFWPNPRQLSQSSHKVFRSYRVRRPRREVERERRLPLSSNAAALTTHALNSQDNAYEPGFGLTVLKHLDLVALAVALPVFLVGGFAMAAYGIVALAWCLQRFIEHVGRRQAVKTGDRRAAIAVIGGVMIGRIWLLGLAVLGAGLIDHPTGLAAGILAVVLFTVHFMTLFIVKPLEEAARR